MLASGEWEATRNFHGIASFHISALYSPWKSWGSVAVDFIRAKKGGPEQIKTFKNTMLGEVYEESGEVIDSEQLQDRATVNIMDGDRIAVPDDVLVATWGADVQHDRLEVELVGWGAGEESWSIAYEIINGSPDNPLTWQKFDQFLTTDWVTESGRRVDVPIGGIDTGDGNTQQKVYEWVKPRMGKRRGALPFKGASTFTAPVWSSPSKPKKGERDAIIKPYMIGSSQCKLVIYERLRLMHFPAHYDPHYFKGLTAEKLITKYDKGFPRKEWHKIRERNEPLDCRVYAYAAMKILNPDFDAIQARLSQYQKPIATQSQKQPVKRARRKMKMRGF
jgi:phage terminase large subunit GpA-like protein